MTPPPAPSLPTSPPSDWVARWAPVLVPEGASPELLDLACGRGRHALALAARGARVTAVDRDPEALASLRAQAAAQGMADRIEVVEADLEAEVEPWPLAGRNFDAVVVTNYLWRPRLGALLDTVRPGGWLLYETFADGQQHLGRPSRPEFLLQPGELLERLRGGWRVAAYEDLRLPAPARCVQRVLARRAGP